MVAHGRGDEADLPAVGTVVGEADLRAVRRQVDLAAVQVQEDQPARRLAEVLHPGDGLLPPVAALLEVHGGADPAQLVRDGPVVGLEAEARAVLLDAQRLVREDPRRGPGLGGERLQLLPGQEQVTAVRRLADGGGGGGPGDRPGRQVHDGGVGGAVGDLDPVEELHRLQVGDQRLLGAGLDVRPDGRAVVDEVQGVLDVAVRREDQGLGGLAGRQVADVLGEQQVQPAQPVLAGDRDDAAVGEVDEAGAVGEGTLLAEQVAVVGGDAFVHALGGNGAGQGQQGALHTPSLRLAHTASAAPFAEQLSHRPKIAKCFMSVSKPNCSRSFAVKSAATDRSASITWEQSRQTRWMWWCRSARW